MAIASIGARGTSISSTSSSTQTITPGRANNVYKLRCQVTDANSNVHVIAAQLSVVAL